MTRRVQEVLLTPERFGLCKERLLPALRERGDPPPRQMCPGTKPRGAWLANLARLLQTSGGTLVRGFCLYELPHSNPERTRASAWRCCFHAVVETFTPNSCSIYVDPSEARRECDDGLPYIFVPSARAHAELTDDQLLSGEWLVGSVLLGKPRLCKSLVAAAQTRGRQHSVVGLSAETLVSKRRVTVSLLPHFGTWARLRGVEEDPETLGELMGMPALAVGTKTDEADAIAAYQSVADNPESYVNGLEGLQLELACREELFAGTLTFEDVRERFFAYFDDAYETMRQAQADAHAQRLRALDTQGA